MVTFGGRCSTPLKWKNVTYIVIYETRPSSTQDPQLYIVKSNIRIPKQIARDTQDRHMNFSKPRDS